VDFLESSRISINASHGRASSRKMALYFLDVRRLHARTCTLTDETTMERLVYFTNACGLLAGAHAACSHMAARDDQRRAGQRGGGGAQ
jgi:hypothetical protein